jgi:hypothetical protein
MGRWRMNIRGRTQVCALMCERVCICICILPSFPPVYCGGSFRGNLVCMHACMCVYVYSHTQTHTFRCAREPGACDAHGIRRCCRGSCTAHKQRRRREPRLGNRAANQPSIRLPLTAARRRKMPSFLHGQVRAQFLIMYVCMYVCMRACMYPAATHHH